MKTNLLHVCTANKFCSKVEVLPTGLLKIQDEGVVGDLQVALVSVEHDCFLLTIREEETKEKKG
jgi:hypothetical protein